MPIHTGWSSSIKRPNTGPVRRL